MWKTALIVGGVVIQIVLVVLFYLLIADADESGRRDKDKK